MLTGIKVMHIAQEETYGQTDLAIHVRHLHQHHHHQHHIITIIIAITITIVITYYLLLLLSLLLLFSIVIIIVTIIIVIIIVIINTVIVIYIFSFLTSLHGFLVGLQSRSLIVYRQEQLSATTEKCGAQLLCRKCFRGVNVLDRHDLSCTHLAHHELESVSWLLFVYY